MLLTSHDRVHLTTRRCEIFNRRGRQEKFLGNLEGNFKLKRRFGKPSHRWENINTTVKT